MALPNTNINVIFNLICTLHVDIHNYMNNLKMKKGKKPALNYYFFAYKVSEIFRSNRLLCYFINKGKKGEKKIPNCTAGVEGGWIFRW